MSRSANLNGALHAVFDGVYGVVQKIQQDLLQFVLANSDGRKLRIYVGLHRDAQLSQMVFTELDDVAQSGLEIGGACRWITLAGKAQQAVHNALHAMGFVPQFLQALDDLLALYFLSQQFRIANDAGKRIVQLVGYSRDELAKRSQFFGPHELMMQP